MEFSLGFFICPLHTIFMLSSTPVKFYLMEFQLQERGQWNEIVGTFFPYGS